LFWGAWCYYLLVDIYPTLSKRACLRRPCFLYEDDLECFSGAPRKVGFGFPVSCSLVTHFGFFFFFLATKLSTLPMRFHVFFPGSLMYYQTERPRLFLQYLMHNPFEGLEHNFSFLLPSWFHHALGQSTPPPLSDYYSHLQRRRLFSVWPCPVSVFFLWNDRPPHGRAPQVSLLV